MASRAGLLYSSWLKRLMIRNYGFKQSVFHFKIINACQGILSSRDFSRAVTVGMLFTLTGDSNRARHLKLLHSDSDANNELVSTMSSNKEKKSTVEGTFNVLKMKLERLGRLNARDIERAVECIEHHSEDFTDDDCLKLLQLTLRMVEDEYRPCADLVQHVWKLSTSRSNAKPTCEHFELYLQACLLAESACTSEDIFGLLEHHQLEPNQKILELLMLILGHHGDVAGATSTLNIMKELKIPVSETIFSALILAHGICKDSGGIQSVLDAMKSVQMNPTNITYEAMINAYGISGQMSQVKQVFAQMKEARIALTQNQMISLLLRLVKHGQAGNQFENLNYVVDLMEVNVGIVDMSKIVLQMIHSGHVREAMHLLPSFPHIRNNNHLYSNASVYIQEMVHAEVEPDLLVEMCKQLHREEINLFSLQVALECSLRKKKEILAWTLLRAIKDGGCSLRKHYFWPLLHMNAVANEPSKLLECVQKMNEMDETPDLETLKDHIIPGLTLSHPDLMMKMLKHAGVTVNKAATPLLIVLIKNNMFNQAFEVVRKTNVSFSLHDLTATLASAWPARPRVIISLLALLIQKNKKNMADVECAKEDWGGQFLLDMAASRAGLSVEQIRPLFEELRKNKIGISESSADLLMTRSNRSIQEAIRNNINIILEPKMGHPPKEQEYNILPHPRSMTADELDGHLVELQTKGLNLRGTLRKLLLKHAAKNDTKFVLSLMKKAKDDGLDLSAGMMASILMAYISNKNADAAVEMYLSIQVEHPSFTLDSYKVIDLSTLLVENGRDQEAVEILKEYINNEVKKTVDTKQIRRNCRNLLIAAASTCNYDLTKELFSILHSGGLVEPDNLALGALVKCKLNRGDLIGAVEEVKMIYKSYSHLPMRTEILIHLIHQSKDLSKRKDSANVDSGKENSSTSSALLEHMLNLIIQSHGSVQARHDLLFACLEAGYPSDARKALQSMGKDLDINQLNRQLDRYSKMERDDVLLHFLTASRGNTAIDRQKIFSSLLNIYYIQSAADKGLSLWTKMQEEDISASQPFLSTLASLLATNNMKIPFQTL